MAATDFMQEMRLVGERLLLKLQRLPQAEPVEIVAFSVILLFTATVVLLLLIACCCCSHCCCPEPRGRKAQVRAHDPTMRDGELTEDKLERDCRSHGPALQP